MIETIEHVSPPWKVLERAAALVKPRGCLAASTPNLATLRHRLEVVVSGRASQALALRVHYP